MPKKKASALRVTSKNIDPTLDALFASSSGPVKAPRRSRYTALLEKRPLPAPGRSAHGTGSDEGGGQEVDDQVLSEISEELDDNDGDDGEDEDSSEASSQGGRGDAGQGEGDAEPKTEEQAIPATDVTDTRQTRRERKRKRKDDSENLEAKYLAELTKDVSEPTGKRIKGGPEKVDDENRDVPVHETMAQDSHALEVERASRTVFLGNVSTEAISSKKAKATLLNHLSSVLDQADAPPQKIESIRFRSVAFATGPMPKRAAYITKSLMTATTQSANAYAVFSSPAAARKVIAELNGSEVLGRHIRVDSVAHPSPMDHRRCIFVGNLGFVDDETVLNTDSEGKTVEKKRSKVPADAEEGLWRTFGKQGKVENVRVVRDPKIRVGKGFAYVQFYDGNDVEAALLLDGKKFPPMLPRVLRVTRAKDPRKTAMALERAKAKAVASGSTAYGTMYKPKITPEKQAAAGRAGKLFGRAGAAMKGKKARLGPHNGVLPEMKTPEQIVFEGKRASAKDGRPKDLKLGRNSKGKTGRPKSRSASRAAEWKKRSA